MSPICLKNFNIESKVSKEAKICFILSCSLFIFLVMIFLPQTSWILTYLYIYYFYYKSTIAKLQKFEQFIILLPNFK